MRDLVRFVLATTTVCLVACSGSGGSVQNLDSGGSGDGGLGTDDAGGDGDGGGDGGAGGDAATGGVGTAIAGILVDSVGVPAPGFAVRVGTSLDISGSDGTFHVTAPALPYRLIVTGRDWNGYDSATVIDDLTRTDPRVFLVNTSRPTPSTSNEVWTRVNGTVTGITFPLTAGQTGRVWGIDPNSNSMSFSSSAMTGDISQLFIYYDEPHPMTKIAGLFYSGNADTLMYLGYGQADVAAMRYATVTLGSPLAMTAPSTATLNGSLTSLPDTNSSVSLDISLDINGVARVNLPSKDVTPGSFSYTTAVIAGATYDLSFQYYSYGRTSTALARAVPPNATVPAFALPPAVALVKPVDGAAMIGPDQEFELMAGKPGELYMLSFYDNDTNAYLTYVTTKTTFKLSDIDTLGTLPSADEIDWLATTVPLADTDAATTGSTSPFDPQQAGAGVPYVYTTSEQHAFTRM